MTTENETPKTSPLNFAAAADNNSSAETSAEVVNEVPQSELAQSVTQNINAVENGQPSAPEPIPTQAAQAQADVAEAPIPAMTAPAVPEGKSVEELQAEKEALDKAIADRQNTQKTAVLEQIKGVMATYNVTTKDVVDYVGGYKQTRQGTKAKPKYKDPASDKTWSGRGKEPLWIKGQDKSKFLIV